MLLITAGQVQSMQMCTRKQRHFYNTLTQWTCCMQDMDWMKTNITDCNFTARRTSGRYKGLGRNRRVSNLSNGNCLGDKYHILFECKHRWGSTYQSVISTIHLCLNTLCYHSGTSQKLCVNRVSSWRMFYLCLSKRKYVVFTQTRHRLLGFYFQITSQFEDRHKLHTFFLQK